MASKQQIVGMWKELPNIRGCEFSVEEIPRQNQWLIRVSVRDKSLSQIVPFSVNPRLVIREMHYVAQRA